MNHMEAPFSNPSPTPWVYRLDALDLLAFEHHHATCPRGRHGRRRPAVEQEILDEQESMEEHADAALDQLLGSVGLVPPIHRCDGCMTGESDASSFERAPVSELLYGALLNDPLAKAAYAWARDAGRAAETWADAAPARCAHAPRFRSSRRHVFSLRVHAPYVSAKCILAAEEEQEGRPISWCVAWKEWTVAIWSLDQCLLALQALAQEELVAPPDGERLLSAGEALRREAQERIRGAESRIPRPSV